MNRLEVSKSGICSAWPLLWPVAFGYAIEPVSVHMLLYRAAYVFLTGPHVMNDPWLRPAFRSWKLKVRHHGLQEQSDVLWIETDKYGPGLEHDIDSVQIAIT
jgi:hypothetical protein